MNRHRSHQRPAGNFPAGRSASPGGGEQRGGEPSVLTEKSGRIVAAHRLLRRSRRTEAGEFLAEGAQAVREALPHQVNGQATTQELFVTEAAAIRNPDLLRTALNAHIPVTQITPRAAEVLSDTKAPQGILARCRTIEVPLRTALGAAPRLVAVLVQTNDPGNAGTIIRLADAAGADAVVMAGDAVDPFNPKVVRATTGSLFHVPIARATDPVELLDELHTAGLKTLASTGSADLDLDEADARGLLAAPTAWLFGSEAHGLPEPVMAGATARIRVPIHGRAESLNLATAAAIMLYAGARAQRR